MSKTIFLLFALALSSTQSFAGFTELGASVNYRRTSIDEFNYSDSTSYTGSIAYYFWERSALELSYTSGLGKLSTRATGAAEITQVQIAQFSMTSLDLILSLAGREDAFQPYIKVGGGYVDKKIFKENEIEGRRLIQEQSGLAPSAGVGLKISLTKQLSLKLGIDAWTTPLGDDAKDAEGQDRKIQIDYAGRAGLGWMF